MGPPNVTTGWQKRRPISSRFQGAMAAWRAPVLLHSSIRYRLLESLLHVDTINAFLVSMKYVANLKAIYLKNLEKKYVTRHTQNAL